MRMTKRQRAFLEALLPVPDSGPPRKGEWAIVPSAAVGTPNELSAVLFCFKNEKAANNAVLTMNWNAKRDIHWDRCQVAAVEVK